VDRNINTPTGSQRVVIEDYGVAFLGIRGKLAEEVSPREHVNVLCAASLLVDSAVSKTCNVDKSIAWDDFKELYAHGHRGGAKGLTTFNKDGSRGSIMKAAEPSSIREGDSCEFDAETGRRSCA
jgi:ribonucleoside-diphosphate reductase alpha chain